MRLEFTKDERQFMERMCRKGLGQRNGPLWWITRIALARSLQLPGVPEGDEFAPPEYSTEGSRLHLDQVTGYGKGTREDYTELLQLLLTVRHQQNFVEDQAAFVQTLNRHVRRGLRDLRSSWRETFSFHDFLYQDLIYTPLFEEEGDLSKEDLGGHIRDEDVQRALAQVEVEGGIIERIEGPRISRFVLSLKRVDDFERLRRSLTDIAFELGLGANSIAMSLGEARRQVTLDIPRISATWRTVTWNEVKGSLLDSEGDLPVCIGTTVLGEPYVFDLSKAPHLLVAGTTGSGKSVCLHSIILSLLSVERTTQLVLIDPKALEFSQYSRCRRLRREIITEMDLAMEELTHLVEEMENRQRRFTEARVRSIEEARTAGLDIPNIVVVIDELADLIQVHSEIVSPLVRLAQKSRAFGINLVLATQRPDAATFPGLIRSNVPSRIALTVQKASESRIILDEVGAENLLMRGDMYVKLSGQPVRRAHGVMIDSADIRIAIE